MTMLMPFLHNLMMISTVIIGVVGFIGFWVFASEPIEKMSPIVGLIFHFVMVTVVLAAGLTLWQMW